MVQRLARTVSFSHPADTGSALAEIARIVIVAGSAVALILSGPFLPF